MGSRNLKTIKGKEYLYYVVSEDGKKQAIYCGLASKPESEKKALRLELRELQTQKKIIAEKAERVKIQMSKIRTE